VISLDPAGAVPENVTNTSALVAGFGAGVGAILDDVADLVAVVAGGLITILGAVTSNMTGSMTTVAAVLLLPTVPGKVAEPVALVAFESSSSSRPVLPISRVTAIPISSAAPSSATSSPSSPLSLFSSSFTASLLSSVTLGTLAGEVAGAVTAIADGAGIAAVGALPGKVTSLIAAVAN